MSPRGLNTTTDLQVHLALWPGADNARMRTAFLPRVHFFEKQILDTTEYGSRMSVDLSWKALRMHLSKLHNQYDHEPGACANDSLLLACKSTRFFSTTMTRPLHKHLDNDQQHS